MLISKVSAKVRLSTGALNESALRNCVSSAMSRPSLRQAYVCVLFYTTVMLIVVSAQTCERLDPKLFASCVNIGHNQTFMLPSSVDKNMISRSLQWYRNQTSNCSIPQSVPNAVDCALHLPLCREGRKTPVPPCRRVCAEMVLGCSKAISLGGLEYLGAMCNALPNTTAETGECFEPLDFTPNQSDYSAIGKCHERLIPMCGDQGYNHTIISNETQALLLKWFYNTTLNSPSLNSSDSSLPPFLEEDLSRYPRCASVLRKMYCVQFFPPCYPEETKRYYGLCKSDCRAIADDCPDFFRYHPEEVALCEDFPEEQSVHGLCAHTSWPKTTPFYFRKRSKPVPPTKENKTKPWIIAVATVVPVIMLIIATIVAVFLWRRYGVIIRAYKKQKDDVTSIVPE